MYNLCIHIFLYITLICAGKCVSVLTCDPTLQLVAPLYAPVTQVADTNCPAVGEAQLVVIY